MTKRPVKIKDPRRYFHAQTASDANLKAACDRKISYESEGKARGVGRERLKVAEGIDRLWVYACACCRRWHLTRVPSPNSVGVTKTERFEGSGV